jgi:hypothetical protein
MVLHCFLAVSLDIMIAEVQRYGRMYMERNVRDEMYVVLDARCALRLLVRLPYHVIPFLGLVAKRCSVREERNELDVSVQPFKCTHSTASCVILFNFLLSGLESLFLVLIDLSNPISSTLPPRR